MITYKVYAENRTQVMIGTGNSAVQKEIIEKDILIYENGSSTAEKSVLTRQIQNRMFVGTYEVTMLPNHPAYQKIHLGRTTVYIDDNGTEVFRGRPVKSKKDKYGRMTVTCESDIKFLIDVPDVFSKQTLPGTIYIYGADIDGTDTGEEVKTRYQTMYDEEMLRTGNPHSLGLYEIASGGVGLYNTAYVETDDQTFTTGKKYYRQKSMYVEMQQYYGMGASVIRENGYDPAENPTMVTSLQYPDHKLRVKDLGKTYDIRIQDIFPDSSSSARYKCVLKKKKRRPPKVNTSSVFITQPTDIEPVILYLGNISLYYPTTQIEGEYDYDEHAIDGDMLVDNEGNETEVTCDWCIMHYVTSEDWEYGFKEETGHTMFVQARATGETSEIKRTEVLVTREDETSVAEMYGEIFCTYTTDEAALTGYNRMVPPERRIFAGNVEISGKLPLTETNTVYSNVQKWLELTDGYAKVRKTDAGYYVLDLLSKSGKRDDSMTLKLDGNVMDYTQDHSIANTVTALYAVGVKQDEWMDGESGDDEEDDRKKRRYKLGGKDTNGNIVSGRVVTNDESIDAEKLTKNYVDSGTTYEYPLRIDDAFPVDKEKNLIYSREAVRMYGLNIQYKDLTLETNEGGRVQETYDLAKAELKMLLTAAHSYNVDGVDPRLLGGTTAPVLGNYYLCALSVFDAQEYMQLNKIVTNMIKPSGSKMTVGDDIHDLSDYVAKTTKG